MEMPTGKLPDFFKDEAGLCALWIAPDNNAIADAIADLGKPEEICSLFAGFQKFLYQVAV